MQDSHSIHKTAALLGITSTQVIQQLKLDARVIHISIRCNNCKNHSNNMQGVFYHNNTWCCEKCYIDANFHNVRYFTKPQAASSKRLDKFMREGIHSLKELASRMNMTTFQTVRQLECDARVMEPTKICRVSGCQNYSYEYPGILYHNNTWHCLFCDKRLSINYGNVVYFTKPWQQEAICTQQEASTKPQAASSKCQICKTDKREEAGGSETEHGYICGYCLANRPTASDKPLYQDLTPERIKADILSIYRGITPEDSVFL